MNSPGSKRSSVNEIASAWLERVHAGNWTGQNQAELDGWLAESSAHRAAYWRLEDAWSNASRLTALRPIRPQPATERRILPILARTAAVVVVLGALGITGANYLASPETRVYATGLGEHETLALSDGSRVELNTNTVLRSARIPVKEQCGWIRARHISRSNMMPFIPSSCSQRPTKSRTWVRSFWSDNTWAVSKLRSWKAVHVY